MKWRSARASSDVLIDAVGAYRDPKTLRKALSEWTRHGSGHVRYLLARACARWHVAMKDTTLSNKLFATLKKLAASDEPGVRIATARALTAFKQPRAVDLLGKLLEDKDWAVRAAAVAARSALALEGSRLPELPSRGSGSGRPWRRRSSGTNPRARFLGHSLGGFMLLELQQIG